MISVKANIISLTGFGVVCFRWEEKQLQIADFTTLKPSNRFLLSPQTHVSEKMGFSKMFGGDGIKGSVSFQSARLNMSKDSLSPVLHLNMFSQRGGGRGFIQGCAACAHTHVTHTQPQ